PRLHSGRLGVGRTLARVARLPALLDERALAPAGRGYGRRCLRRRRYEGRVPSVTVSFTVLPLRVTLIVTVSPGLCALTLAGRSSAAEIALPSMAVTRSPALRPPLSAGEPLTTVVTCAPSFDVES